MTTLYSDSLVDVSEEEIVFHRYYFPSGKDRRLPWNQIERVQLHRLTTWGGKWRIWGTGDLRTWSPEDRGRPKRDLAFIVHLRNSFLRIGFTVEDSQKMEGIFREKGLLEET